MDNFTGPAGAGLFSAILLRVDGEVAAKASRWGIPLGMNKRRQLRGRSRCLFSPFCTDLGRPRSQCCAGHGADPHLDRAGGAVEPGRTRPVADAKRALKIGERSELLDHWSLFWYCRRSPASSQPMNAIPAA